MKIDVRIVMLAAVLAAGCGRDGGQETPPPVAPKDDPVYLEKLDSHDAERKACMTAVTEAQKAWEAAKAADPDAPETKALEERFKAALEALKENRKRGGKIVHDRMVEFQQQKGKQK